MVKFYKWKIERKIWIFIFLIYLLNGCLVEYMYIFDKFKFRGDFFFKLNLYDCDMVFLMVIWNIIFGFESNKVIVYVYDMIYYKK